MIDRAYFKFLTYVEGTQRNAIAVDRDSLALLDVIAMYADHDPLSVTDAMALASIASPATIHRKLDILAEAGLVAHEYRDDNRRTKYLVLTKKSQAYYDFLSTSIREAAK